MEIQIDHGGFRLTTGPGSQKNVAVTWIYAFEEALKLISPAQSNLKGN